jgi:primosomal protein N'
MKMKNKYKICPDCDGKLILLDDGYLECQECGMQYTIDEKGRFCSESYYPEADEFDDF